MEPVSATFQTEAEENSYDTSDEFDDIDNTKVMQSLKTPHENSDLSDLAVTWLSRDIMSFSDE